VAKESAASAPAATPAPVPASATAPAAVKVQSAVNVADLVLLKGSSADAHARLAKKKYVFVYLSAHWCPPCREFTPHLVKWYNVNYAKNGDFELLFFSRDEDEAAMLNYMRETAMPWAAIKPTADKTRAFLKERAGGRGIPNLILFDSDGKVLQTSFVNEEHASPALALQKYEALRGK
jgi:nucleoredoxin